MFSFKLPVVAAIIQLVQAQQSSLEYVNIAAGENSLTFIHPETPAGIGDVITWSFAGTGPQNHSVIQSTYDNPCHYLPGGFYSGFVPVPPGSQNGKLLFLVRVNDTNPIYYYSGGDGDCQAGMVGVINPPCVGNGINSTGSFNDYKALAEAVTSVGPPPSAIQGGQLVSTYPTGTPTGTNGPYFTGFSASCTAGTNTSSNSTESTTTSAISSATTSGTSSGTSSASISATQPVSSSKGERVYGVSFRNQDLPSLVWQVGYQLGLIGAVLLAFM